MEAIYVVLVPFAVAMILITLSPVGRRTPVFEALRWRPGLAVALIALVGVWILGTLMVDLIAD